ncbi:MAG: hypothetical protein ACOZQL_09145 [Myxococcota bacterium]
MTRWLLPFALAFCSSFVLVACPQPEPEREICGDGLDNDGNGLKDCDDRDCIGQPMCIPPDYGKCSKCSLPCTSQPTCVTSYLDERPIPYCTNGVCTATETFIQPRIELNTRTNWQGLTLNPQSGTTRFIKKVASDGTPVTCATVAAIAADRNAPGAIEASGKLIVQGLDVTRVTNPQLGQGISYAFVNTQTGSDFLIWTELWGGAPDSNTKLPSGRRFGYGCFENAADVGGPLVPADNCPSTTSDAGTCRVFRLVMPPPET